MLCKTAEPPFVSVIITTYNRAEMIGITLESLIHQNYPEDNYEIIVCDNNSSDSTKAVVSRYQSESRAPVIYLSECRQGVHYARNTAAKHARGEILYYTDDDMVAHSDLLREIIRPFSLDGDVATVTGKILPRWEGQPPDWVLNLCNNSLLSLHDEKEELIISSHDCCVFSCHQAIRKSILFKAGGFNPENTAGVWIGDGETGLNIKIRELGYKFAYIGSSVTHHMIPAFRQTQRYLNRRLGNQGNCDSYTDYRKHRYSKAGLYARILSHVVSLIKQLIYIIVKVLLSKESWRMSRAYLSYYLSRIRYDYRLSKDEALRRLVLKYDWLDGD
ncbi:MAG: glycosyltransferase family 2 protein [Syntrophales bacterium]